MSAIRDEVSKDRHPDDLRHARAKPDICEQHHRVRPPRSAVGVREGDAVVVGKQRDEFGHGRQSVANAIVGLGRAR